MKPFEVNRITSPNGKFFVDIDWYEEHHMGASTTRIYLHREIGGVSEFFATGGQAVFSPDSKWLVIYDRKIVLSIELDSEQCFNFSPPAAVDGWFIFRRSRPRFFRSVTVTVSAVHVCYETAFHTGQEQRELGYGANEWEKGLGVAKQGQLPSAYEPNVNLILGSRRTATPPLSLEH
jgi:hypothetical protein